MDEVHEVLVRSAVVSLSATAHRGRARRADRHRARAVAPAGPPAAATFVNTGMAIPRWWSACGRARPLAERPARKSRADLHAARDGDRTGPDRHAADRRHHDGGTSGAAAGSARTSCAPSAPAARRWWCGCGWRRASRCSPRRWPGFGHAISEVGAATIVGGNIHGQTQVMTTRSWRTSAGESSAWRSPTPACCSRSRSPSTPCSRRCSSAPPRGRSRSDPPPAPRARRAPGARDRPARGRGGRAAGRPGSKWSRQDLPAAPDRGPDPPTAGRVSSTACRPPGRHRAAPPDRLRDPEGGPAVHDRRPERRAAAPVAGRGASGAPAGRSRHSSA